MKAILQYIYKFYIRQKYGKQITLGKNSQLGFNRLKLNPKNLISIGEDSIIGGHFYFDKDNCKITIGNRVYIGGSKFICAEGIEVGDDVLIAWGCTIVDHTSHSIHFEKRKNDVLDLLHHKKNWSEVTFGKVKIEKRSWIGFDVKILKGVTIGEGAVVTAGAIVTKDVAPYTMVGGIPAKMIKKIEH